MTCLFLQATNEVVTRVPKSTKDEMEAAVAAAKAAFDGWSKETILTRQQVMFNYQALIKENLVSKKMFCTRYSDMQLTKTVFSRQLMVKITVGVMKTSLKSILEPYTVLKTTTASF